MFYRSGIYLLHVGVQSHWVSETCLQKVNTPHLKWSYKHDREWFLLQNLSIVELRDFGRGCMASLRLLSLYRYFVPLALLLLPFGRKRSICDHHRWLGFCGVWLGGKLSKYLRKVQSSGTEPQILRLICFICIASYDASLFCVPWCSKGSASEPFSWRCCEVCTHSNFACVRLQRGNMQHRSDFGHRTFSNLIVAAVVSGRPGLWNLFRRMVAMCLGFLEKCKLCEDGGGG